ncbi:MAG: hypothetical protein M1813_005594 [Trichoglossum hirsutum]|nr:MAG: hypothetical protein M1813_005594 [Trichoglossum hirsutum]
MLAPIRTRGSLLCVRRYQTPVLRAYSSASTNDPIPTNDPSKGNQNVPNTNAVPTTSMNPNSYTLQELSDKREQRRVMQSPNRERTWSRSQQPRSKAMVGPRFEQTIMEDQPQPQAAIGLIHRQPVRWVKERVVSCDGGGGPLGHPRIFINVDKPEIAHCTYCGLPFANHHHRAHLESLPQTSYPLTSQGDTAVVPESQRVSDEPLGQR